MDDLVKRGYREPTQDERKASRVPSGVGNTMSKDILMQQQAEMRRVINALQSFQDIPIGVPVRQVNISPIVTIKVQGLAVVHALI